MDIDCPGCSSTNSEFTSDYVNPQKAFLSAKTLRKCHDCGLVFAYPMPSEGDLEEYYREKFFRAFNSSFTDAFMDFSYQLAQSRLLLILKYISLEGGKRFLDVGAGNAEFGKALKEVAPESIYEAVEPGEECRRKWGNWVQKAYSTLAEAEKGKYSIIVLNQVLEHINRPLNFLKETSEYLVEGGTVFIDVPNRDDLYKKTVEPHLLFWEKKSLENVLMEAGFKVLFCDSVGMSRDQFRMLFFESSLAKKALSPWRWSLLMNKGLARLGIDKRFDTFKKFQAETYGEGRQWVRCLATK
jgi:SAM-dependent methyltransferase